MKRFDARNIANFLKDEQFAAGKEITVNIKGQDFAVTVFDQLDLKSEKIDERITAYIMEWYNKVMLTLVRLESGAEELQISDELKESLLQSLNMYVFIRLFTDINLNEVDQGADIVNLMAELTKTNLFEELMNFAKQGVPFLELRVKITRIATDFLDIVREEYESLKNDK